MKLDTWEAQGLGLPLGSLSQVKGTVIKKIENGFCVITRLGQCIVTELRTQEAYINANVKIALEVTKNKN